MIESLASSPLLLVAVLAVLLLAARALLGGISAVAGIIGDLFRALFASLRALAVVSLLIALVVAAIVARVDHGVAVGLVQVVAA